MGLSIGNSHHESLIGLIFEALIYEALIMGRSGGFDNSTYKEAKGDKTYRSHDDEGDDIRQQ
jgi:hypothetical protein